MTSTTFGAAPKQTTMPTADPTRDVAMILFTIEQLVQARERLALCIAATREINVAALNDPALADHPQREQMADLYEERAQDERNAWIQGIEIGNQLGASWSRLTTQDRNRYGIARLIGADPAQDTLIFTVWNSGTVIAWLAPLPEPWSIPTDLAHMVGREPGAVTTWRVEDLMHEPACSF